MMAILHNICNTDSLSIAIAREMSSAIGGTVSGESLAFRLRIRYLRKDIVYTGTG